MNWFGVTNMLYADSDAFQVFLLSSTYVLLYTQLCSSGTCK